METIVEIRARQIFDSRGNPTVEADVILSDNSIGSAAVPSGASTGEHEAVEVRDGGELYNGLGVQTAIDNIREVIAPELAGMPAADQYELDCEMVDLDGTDDRSNLGANAILAVSLASAKAQANSQGIQLYEHLGELVGTESHTLPMPMMNILNGGRHAPNSTDFQEYMIVPVSATSFAEAMRYGTDVFHKLGLILETKGYTTTVGDEGGYAPSLVGGNEEALELIIQAINDAGYKPGDDVAIALDIAASELYDSSGTYRLPQEGKLSSKKELLTQEELLAWYAELAKTYPIVSIEDGLDQNDLPGWQKMTKKLKGIQIVGDDLLVTNTDRIEKAIGKKAGNAVLVKPNQVGTLTETICAVKLAQRHGWGTIMSHRSGETEDTTIADLAVGLNTGQIKAGSLSRSERMAKYNRLLRIEERLGKMATFGGE